MRPPVPRPPRLARLQTGLSLAGYAILVAGLAGSAWAYRRSTNAASDASRDLLAGMQDTKSFQLNMEEQGGKANLLSYEIGQWFTGLWQGRNLAYTLAGLAVGLALMCFVIAYVLPDLPPIPPPHETRDAAAGTDGPAKAP